MASHSSEVRQDSYDSTFPTSPEDMNRYHLEQTGNRGQVHITSSAPIQMIEAPLMNYQLQMQMIAYYQYWQSYQVNPQAPGSPIAASSPYGVPRSVVHRSPVSNGITSSRPGPMHEAQTADSGVFSGLDSPMRGDLSIKHSSQDYDSPLDLSRSTGKWIVPFPHLSPSSSSDDSALGSPVSNSASAVNSESYSTSSFERSPTSLKSSSSNEIRNNIKAKPDTPQQHTVKKLRKQSAKSTPYTVQCEVCNKVLKSRSILTVHMRTHTGEKPYTCETCGKSFADHSVYWRHKRVHTGEKRYSCDICGQRFTQRGNISRHKEAVHGIIKVD